ncbi:hypothetical protein CCR80_08180 [Rhodothalassium salexigens]|uniref:GspE/PulE family protein n=1 Tax=Rhodothalassium salexigens TaxID=1086 RepID=UPI0019145DE5|nr:GspE/PulE family protein [Rhodothalassium salexigens]MBK5921007.1 hypothetical protein [Rhodothalassium salexigens]
MDARRIGDILLDAGVITPRDQIEAANFQAEVGGLFGQALLRLGALSEPDLLAHLAAQLGLGLLSPETAPGAEAAHAARTALALPPGWFQGEEVPVWLDDAGRLNAAPRRTLDPAVRETLESRAAARAIGDGCVVYHLAPNALIDACLALMSPAGGDDALGDDDLTDAQRLREMAEEAPVIDFVNGVFAQALTDRASDIHIEPSEHAFQVRSRIDGVLHTKTTQPKRRFDAVVSRVKLLSGMDIAERRLPQDGRQTIRVGGEEIDLRVSSLPTSWGESLVLRLLRKQRTLLDLESLGLEGRARQQLDLLLGENNGIILVTGPTGSGKSTTLYRALQQVNDGIRKIITIEDPVEYDMDGVSQIPVKADIGYTFARGLRAILRQDPDVIMVGEIRDGETAAIAAQAALTGHLVFSTLHTNSSLAAIPRLTDLGLEPFLVASALRGTAAQRLVRRLCPECSEPVTDPAAIRADEAFLARLSGDNAVMAEALAATPAAWRRAVGCRACSGTGYQGRQALFEIAAIDDALQEAIMARAPLRELARLARGQGFMTLLEDGAVKARAGSTTLAEVMRVLGTGGAATVDAPGGAGAGDEGGGAARAALVGSG